MTRTAPRALNDFGTIRRRKPVVRHCPSIGPVKNHDVVRHEIDVAAAGLSVSIRRNQDREMAGRSTAIAPGQSRGRFRRAATISRVVDMLASSQYELLARLGQHRNRVVEMIERLPAGGAETILELHVLTRKIEFPHVP